MTVKTWSNASVRGAVILAFAYREAEQAIIAMDAGDDTDFATWFEELGTDLITQGAVDLSHNAGAASIQFVLTPQVALEATGELLDAYDRLRASRGRGRTPELRETVMAIFKVRDQLMDPELANRGTVEHQGPAWLDWQMDRFPLPAATIKKLKQIDVTTLRQLYLLGFTRACGLLGMTEPQLSKIDDLIWRYLCAATDIEDRLANELLRSLCELLGQILVVDDTDGLLIRGVGRSWRLSVSVLLEGDTSAIERYVRLLRKLIAFQDQPIPWDELLTDDYGDAPEELAREGVRMISDLLRYEFDPIEGCTYRYMESADLNVLREFLEIIREPDNLRLLRYVEEA